jgi:cytochrome c5
LAQAPHASQAAKSAAATGDKLERITLPNYSGEIPKGPNVQVYEKDCLLCHSARYVTTQPGFSRSTWEKEVKKMVDAYGATVPEADQSKIVDYLVAIKGAAESKPGPSAH